MLQFIRTRLLIEELVPNLKDMWRHRHGEYKSTWETEEEEGLWSRVDRLVNISQVVLGVTVKKDKARSPFVLIYSLYYFLGVPQRTLEVYIGETAEGFRFGPRRGQASSRENAGDRSIVENTCEGRIHHS